MARLAIVEKGHRHHGNVGALFGKPKEAGVKLQYLFAAAGRAFREKYHALPRIQTCHGLFNKRTHRMAIAPFNKNRAGGCNQKTR